MRLRCVGLLTALLTLGCAKRPAPIQPVPDSGHLLGELRVDTPGYLTFELVRPAFTTVVLFRGDQPPMLLQSEPTASPVGIAGPSVLSVRLSPALFGRRVSWVSRPACVRRVLTSRIEDGRPVREYQRLCDGLYRTGSLVRSSPGNLVTVVASPCAPDPERLVLVKDARWPEDLDRLLSGDGDCTIDRRTRLVR